MVPRAHAGVRVGLFAASDLDVSRKTIYCVNNAIWLHRTPYARGEFLFELTYSAVRVYCRDIRPPACRKYRLYCAGNEYEPLIRGCHRYVAHRAEEGTLPKRTGLVYSHNRAPMAHAQHGKALSDSSRSPTTTAISAGREWRYGSSLVSAGSFRCLFETSSPASP